MATSLTDAQLLREFAVSRSQSAFGELVERHQNMVFATARRRLQNDAAAADVTQNVFLALANKAVWLAGKTTVGGWLYKSALLEAARRQRDETRRVNRERLYAEEMNLNPSSETDEEALRARRLMPVLDDAISSLGESDREAILLRFMQGLSLRDTGAALGTTEEAARKRVSRALDKLSVIFKRKGVSITTAALAAALLPQAAKAAPASLGAGISASVSSLPATSAAGLAYLKILGLSKLQVVAACLAAASVPVVVQTRRIAELESANGAMASRLAAVPKAVTLTTVAAAPPVTVPPQRTAASTAPKPREKDGAEGPPKREHNGWLTWQKWQRESRISALWERLGLDESQLTGISAAMEQADADLRAAFDASRASGERANPEQLAAVSRMLDETIAGFLNSDQAAAYRQFCSEEEHNRQEMQVTRNLLDLQGMLHLTEAQKDRLYALFMAQAARQKPGSFDRRGPLLSEEDTRQMEEILTQEQWRLWRERTDAFLGSNRQPTSGGGVTQPPASPP